MSEFQLGENGLEIFDLTVLLPPVSFENDLALWCFFIGNLVTRSPLPVFQILGFDMKISVGEEFAGRAHFSHAAGAAFHILVRDELPIPGLKGTSGHIALSGKVVKRDDLMLLIPNEERFAAVSAVIDRMKEPDRLTV